MSCLKNSAHYLYWTDNIVIIGKIFEFRDPLAEKFVIIFKFFLENINRFIHVGSFKHLPLFITKENRKVWFRVRKYWYEFIVKALIIRILSFFLQIFQKIGGIQIELSLFQLFTLWLIKLGHLTSNGCFKYILNLY